MAIETSMLRPNGMTQPDSDEDFQTPPLGANAIKNDDGEESSEEGDKNTVDQLKDWIEDNNIAKSLDDETLGMLAQLVVREYEIDEESRSEWKDEAEQALKFATQEAEPKQYPWPRASNIIFPLITTASLQFGARAYPAVIQNKNVAKGTIWGTDDGTPATQTGKPDGPPVIQEDGQIQWLIPPGDKTKRATKIGEHMSWQLLSEMPEWEAQTDQLLHQLPIVGGAVRKTYFDFTESMNCSVLVPLMNLVWNKHATSFEKSPRHTEILKLYPHEVKERELADEMFLKISYAGGEDVNAEHPPGEDTEAPREYLEQHRRYDLDNDGYPEPLIITVHKGSSQVVRVVARYEADGIFANDKGEVMRIEPTEHYTLYPFLPDPKGGSYPVGFGHLLKPLNEGINTTINQMFDAGHLQIAGGGFIGTNLSLAAGPTTFRLGEYIPVNNKGQDIRAAVYPLPFPGPNEVLFQLLGFLVNAAKETASIQDILTGDSARLADTQPTTLLALIEQGMKVYTAIYKRIYRALKQELAKLYRLNELYLEDDIRYKQGDEWKIISREDYRLGGGVEPISDPTMVTDMQKLTRAGIVLGFKDDPLFNPIEVRRQFLDAAMIPNIDKLLMSAPPPPPPMAQIAMQKEQAELGKIRAQEMQAQSQAFLNMAQARAVASDAQMEWIDKQLEVARLHIESLNTTVKAAAIDAQMHGHNTAHRIAHMNNVVKAATTMRGEGARPGVNVDIPHPAPEQPDVPDAAE